MSPQYDISSAASVPTDALKPGSICLWTLPIDEATVETAARILLKTLSVAEIREARDIKREARRGEFIVGRAMLRQALSAQLHVPMETLRIARDANQKPHVASPKNGGEIEVSISHTEGLIACLVACSPAAAVDVEKIQHTVDLTAVAAEVLSPLEREEIQDLFGSAWTERFFDYWTLKEAYAKATGLGLQMAFNGASFLRDQYDQIGMQSLDGLNTGRDWQFWCLHPSPSHTVSIAARRNGRDPLELVTRQMRFATPDILLAA